MGFVVEDGGVLVGCDFVISVEVCYVIVGKDVEL